MPDWSYETATPGSIAGVDEVGRGPLAGPVLAAAVVLDRERLPADLAAMIDDSKALSAARRLVIHARLPAFATIGVGRATAGEIDRLNILRAALLAMRRAILALDPPPASVLVDGPHVPDDLPCAARAIIGGDRRSLSVAAASIVAKVTRDRLMARLATRYPGYGWERNAGYGTAEHLKALARLGPSPQHRRSFRPVINILSDLSPNPHDVDSGKPLSL